MQETPYDNFTGFFFKTGGITRQFILPLTFNKDVWLWK